MKLMVIDGNSLINRAFYGIRMLTTKDGQPTNAVYGFVNILLKLLDEEKPDALCVTFDRKAPTFRHLAYEGYKAQRKGMPDELAAQLPVLKDVLAAMNIPRYELDGWEADDLIGTIAARDTAAGWETVIVTGDKDSLQLVSDATRVKLVSTRMGQTTTKEMTPETFREAYGFDPVHIVDLKALMGDTSDNIPGVKGIGEKTAMDLIQRYQSVEAIYADVEGVEAKPAVKKKLAEGEEQARMSYDLATIRCDAPIDFSPEDARRREPDGPALYELFLALEFNKLIDKMGLSGGPAAGRADKPAAGAVRQERVTDRVRMEELVEQLLFLARGDNDTQPVKPVAFDLTVLAGEVLREEEMIHQDRVFLPRWGEAPIPVRADQGLIKQVMRILMDNSVKYSPPDGRVYLRVTAQEGYARVTVQDEGMGIAPQGIPHIFDRFYRTDQSRDRRTGGTGLGLSIAKWIVDRHGGWFEVVSREGVGTRISFLLPSAPASTEEEAL